MTFPVGAESWDGKELYQQSIGLLLQLLEIRVRIHSLGMVSSQAQSWAKLPSQSGS
jgi:hypothetical protein